MDKRPASRLTRAQILSLSAIWILLLFSQLSKSKATPTSLITSRQNHTEKSLEIKSSSGVNNDSIDSIECPSLCICHYDAQEQHLKISCRKTEASHHERRLILSNGITRLGLNHVTLNYFTIIALTLHGKTPQLTELSLHSVILDPVLFIKADILKKSKTTLKKLRICDVTIESPGSVSKTTHKNILTSHIRYIQNLESLSLCNSPHEFSSLLLSVLPKVAHITMFNASVTTLDPAAFSGLSDTLLSLNLSTNRITNLPWGLFSQVPMLTTLDLSHNRLQHLQEEVFVGLKALRKLDLSFNRIMYADAYVFTPLISLHALDISQNDLLQIFEPYFEDNLELRTLLMRHTWAHDSFLDPSTATRSLTEMDKLIDTLQRVETLDLRDNEMRIIPESLTHVKHLKRIYLTGNSWTCSCLDQWVLDWLVWNPVSIDNHNDTSQIMCHGIGKNESFGSYMQQMNCSNTNLTAKTPRKYYGIQGKSKTLKCHPQRPEAPRVYWTLPRSGYVLHSSHSPELIASSYHRVLSNGDLLISNLTLEAYGLYICVAEYPNLNITHFIHLGMDTSIFLDVKLASIVVGWLTSFGFLMTVLTIQLIRRILNRYGIDCPNVTAPYKTRRVRRFFENMEQHKNSQLEKLRDNYNLQVKRVKENCMSQVERIRESYTSQTKSLSDIRDYGAQQIQTVRDQYHDQIRRVSSYSTHQLCKVRENYVFQRNRVGKFSSHQLLRLRETYKWQAQTVNKILENLPKTLNFDSCRGVGVCGRSESIYLDDMVEIRSEGLLLDPSHLECQALLPLTGLDGPRTEHVSVIFPMEDISLSEETSHAMGDTDNMNRNVSVVCGIQGNTNEKEDQSNPSTDINA